MQAQLAKRLEQALNRIEAGLATPLSLAGIAGAAHLSPYHFARLFRALYGYSVMGYVRRRRLGAAVVLLRERADLSVLDVALACGLGSNEAFSRAFRQRYGILPVTFRRNAGLFHLPLQGRLTVTDIASDVLTTPTFTRREAFRVVGCAGEFAPDGDTQTDAIGLLWARFVPRIGEIGQRCGDPAVTYGVIALPGEGERQADRFTYLAGVQVASFDAIPEGMTGADIPAREYAVFAYSGGVGPNLPRAMGYIFGEWLPTSGYVPDGIDFEYYDERFNPQTGQGTFFLYIPVRREAGTD